MNELGYVVVDSGRITYFQDYHEAHAYAKGLPYACVRTLEPRLTDEEIEQKRQRAALLSDDCVVL